MDELASGPLEFFNLTCFSIITCLALCCFFSILKTIGAIIPNELRKRWKFNLGKSNDVLEEIFNRIDNVDIFIHDSLHTYKNMMFEFDCAERNLDENGIIISDDVLDNDAFFDFTNKKGLHNNLIKVKDDSGLGLMIKN